MDGFSQRASSNISTDAGTQDSVALPAVSQSVSHSLTQSPSSSEEMVMAAPCPSITCPVGIEEDRRVIQRLMETSGNSFPVVTRNLLHTLVCVTRQYQKCAQLQNGNWRVKSGVTRGVTFWPDIYLSYSVLV